MAKLLFSHSYFYKFDEKQWEVGMPYPPLGTIVACSHLRENDHEVALFDVCLKDNPEELEAVLLQEKPDYLVLYDDGFNYLTKMCLTNMRIASYKMIAIAKKHNCTVIVSSSDSTDHYDKYLDNDADVILLGEGENTLVEVCSGMELTDIKGIVYAENNEIKNNGRRATLKDLDSLPLPAWDLIDIQEYKNVWKEKGNEFTINMATTRGCPYKCNWCAKPIYGQKYNTRSPKKVVAEMLWIQKHFEVTKYWMCDDIFGLKPGWVQEFNQELKANNLKINYKIQSRADLLLQDDNIKALANSGLEEVWIGAESGSQKILDAMDKGTSIAQIEECTQLLKANNIRVAFFLQFGYLGETKKDIDATFELLLRCMPDDIGVSVSYPLPGTLFYEKVKTQLTAKANWTDSDDLALMFSNTFNQEYYKILHRYIHKIFRDAQAKETIQKSMFSVSGVKAILKRGYYAPYKIYYKQKLNALSNHS